MTPTEQPSRLRSPKKQAEYAALVAAARVCSPESHSWRAVDFEFKGYRPGGGIANDMRRVCETCGAEHHQIEVSWPDDRTTVEPIT